MTSQLQFLKQYGERRTGTNYLRGLVSATFEHLTVLMHVLGDKHSVPCDLDTSGISDPYEWVSSRTWALPAKTSNRNDARQIEYIRSIADPLYAAAVSQRLGFVISIKDPYAWTASICRFSGVRWNKVNDQWTCAFVRDCCGRFNTNYRAWAAMLTRFPERATLVRYETLLEDPDKVLQSIARISGLPCNGSGIPGPNYRMNACFWDFAPSRPCEYEFDGGYYTNRTYLDDLTPAMVKAVTRTIDWDLFAPLGYQPVDRAS